MVQPRTPVAHQPSRAGGRRTPRRYGWPIVAACVPMLTITTVLVFAHQVSVTFLILFASVTVTMALLMAGIGYPRAK